MQRSLVGSEMCIRDSPLRGILMLVVLVVFWIVGKKLEQHFMGSKKE
ncbi:hypothetical protein JMUB7512_27960 [Staphylococcus aureus]